jgi:antitoxin VapB
MPPLEGVQWCEIGVLALNIKNREVEESAAEVAEMARETKTEAIRRALLECRALLRANGVTPRRNLREYLETYVWPGIPPDLLGKRISKAERDRLLGYGPDGLPR